MTLHPIGDHALALTNQDPATGVGDHVDVGFAAPRLRASGPDQPRPRTPQPLDGSTLHRYADMSGSRSPRRRRSVLSLRALARSGSRLAHAARSTAPATLARARRVCPCAESVVGGSVRCGTLEVRRTADRDRRPSHDVRRRSEPDGPPIADYGRVIDHRRRASPSDGSVDGRSDGVVMAHPVTLKEPGPRIRTSWRSRRSVADSRADRPVV